MIPHNTASIQRDAKPIRALLRAGFSLHTYHSSKNSKYPRKITKDRITHHLDNAPLAINAMVTGTESIIGMIHTNTFLKRCRSALLYPRLAGFPACLFLDINKSRSTEIIVDSLIFS